MKILVDMNLSPRWVEFLASAGHECVHWCSIGDADAPDIALMEHAAKHDCVVLTHDLDFGGILAATAGKKPSVVQIRAENLSPAAIGAAVLRALVQTEAQLRAGALVTVDPGRARVTLLPLPSAGA
ncbi:MAG TPA: DUF5615 family PIN-like protein [Steroidobacteraceae bacterium]